MSIELTEGDLLRADAEALVNTVNCVGFMGRGIAAQFKRAFPANFKAYKKACEQGEVVPGRMFVTETDATGSPLDRTFGLGYGLDIYAFESWAKSHPTHVAIFDRFLEMAGTFGEAMRLKLWHEVSVMPPGGAEFEYIGCHNQTGLLCCA